jgi:hypothetical protein
MGADVGGEIRLDLPDIGVGVPVRVETVSEPPRFLPGEDILVTGIIECVFEDSTAIDSLCYLEAHRFGGPTLEPDSVWVLVQQFRRKGRISRNKGTVAYLNLAGREFFGVNASLDDDLSFVDEARERTMRETWHERLTPTHDYGRRGARYLVHAEGHVLMRAYRQLGYLPPEMTLFVDRETCHWCVDGLGSLMKAMEIRTLTILQKGKKEPLLLETGSLSPAH